MGCNCKKKGKVKESKRPIKTKKEVIKLTETDLRKLINKVMKNSK